VAQVVERLLGKCKALNLNPSTIKKKKKKRKKKKAQNKLFFEIRSHYIAQTGLTLGILLPLPPELLALQDFTIMLRQTFLWNWGLNSGQASKVGTPLLERHSRQGVLQINCPGWPQTEVPLISTSQVARIRDVRHQCLDR
jgi:hypothetical protein